MWANECCSPPWPAGMARFCLKIAVEMNSALSSRSNFRPASSNSVFCRNWVVGSMPKVAIAPSFALGRTYCALLKVRYAEICDDGLYTKLMFPLYKPYQEVANDWG